MRNFLQIGEKMDTLPMLHALQRNSGLWNQDRLRATFNGSPHKEVDDIWVKFLAPGTTEEAAGNDITSEWYPSYDVLRACKDLILPVMRRVEAYSLERVFFSRLAPGAQISLHKDTKGAYANLPDIARYHIVIQGLPGSVFICGDEQVNMRTGEVWWFRHGEGHGVRNASQADRIHLIADMRLFK